MTEQVYNFVKTSNLLDGPTLEIGSMDVNGTVRNLFSDYIGVDARVGKNVDIVASGHSLPFPSCTFRNVLYLETIEHDDKFWLTIDEAKRVLMAGGSLVITAPGIACQRHDYPSDYWRFFPDGVRSLVSDMDIVRIESDANTTMIVAKKRIA